MSKVAINNAHINSNSLNKTNVFDYIQLDFKNNKIETNLEIVEGVVRAKVEKNINSLNEFTVSSIAQNFSLFLNKKSKKTKVFVTHDNSFDGIMFSKVFASTLISEGVETYFNYKNKPLNSALSILVANKSEEKIDYIVNFSSYINNYHSISFYDKNGLLFDSNTSKEINLLISETNFLNITIPINDVPSIKWNESIDEYKNNLKSNINIDNVKLTISNNYECVQDILENLVDLNGINCNYLSLNKFIKKENQITRHSILNSLLKHRDIIINFTNDVNSIEIVIKHKKRWKFISYNDLTLLYLKYQKDNEADLENKEVFYSYLSSKYINHLCNQYNISSSEYELSSEIYASSKNQKNNKDILVATNGYDFFITNKNTSLCSDPILNIKTILEIVSYYKNKGQDVYDVLTQIYLDNGIFHYKFAKSFMDLERANLFFNRIQNLKEINNIKVNRIRKRENISNSFEVILNDKTVINFKYNKNQRILITTYSLWPDKNLIQQEVKKRKSNVEANNFINLIVKEKRIENQISSLKEVFDHKRFTWRGFVKYFVLTIVFIALCYLMFTFIISSGIDDLWFGVRYVLTQQRTYAYLIPGFILLTLFQTLLDCWFLKRTLQRLNQEVKIRHLFVASYISSCISTITPMIYGGESVGYWYLRRKGLSRGPLASAYMVQSLLAQVTIILFSAIFVPIGFARFYLTISQGNLGALIITLALVGIVIDIFSAVMISLLTFNKKLTTSLSTTLNKFVEWIPFIITRDSLAKGAQLKYEFQNINESAQLIFTKGGCIVGFIFFIELLLYRSINRMLNVGAIGSIIADFVNTTKFHVLYGYFDILAAQTLVGAVNGINFVIPGGLGISDWAAQHIMASLYKGFEVPQNSEYYYYNIKVLQALSRIIFTFVGTILSTLALFTVFVGESRVDKYKKIQKTLTQQEIKEGRIKIKSKFYNWAMFGWALGVAMLITAWYLIYEFGILSI